MLASEPTEQHMFSVEDVDGAINGLYSALTGSIYNATAPGSPGPSSDLVTE